MTLLVTADDRTGALEVAGAIAQRTGRWVPVRTRSAADRHEAGTEPAADSGVSVVDLATRHVDAAAAATAVVTTARLHKTDSLLRGNWAHEVAALARSGRRVVLVPALPSQGRTCEQGRVCAHGIPVSDRADAGAAARSSRPLDHLLAAGISARDLHELTVAQLGEWLARTADHRGAVAVVDATTLDHCEAAARACAASERVVLAGPADPLVAAAAQLLTEPATRTPPTISLPLLRPVLVVCGSLHEIVRAQIDALTESGVPLVIDDPQHGGRGDDTARAVGAALEEHGRCVLMSPMPPALPVRHDEAHRTAASLAATIAALGSAPTIVVLGGDTAAAVLGDDPVEVGGLLRPGMPWLRTRRVAERTPRTVVTRAGGFGAPDDLLRIV